MISAKEVLGILQRPGLDPSVLPQHDLRWARLRSRVDTEVGLRDPFGGAIEDAMTATTEGSTRLRTPAEPADEIAGPRWPQAQGG